MIRQECGPRHQLFSVLEPVGDVSGDLSLGVLEGRRAPSPPQLGVGPSPSNDEFVIPLAPITAVDQIDTSLHQTQGSSIDSAVSLHAEQQAECEPPTSGPMQRRSMLAGPSSPTVRLPCAK